MFSEQVEAWRHGPVVPSIYHEFKHFGRDHVTSKATDVHLNHFDSSSFFELREVTSLSNIQKRIVALTWKFYKKYTGIELVELTHSRGTPWELAYSPNQNKTIDVDLMRKYYKLLIKNILKSPSMNG